MTHFCKGFLSQDLTNSQHIIFLIPKLSLRICRSASLVNLSSSLLSVTHLIFDWSEDTKVHTLSTFIFVLYVLGFPLIHGMVWHFLNGMCYVKIINFFIACSPYQSSHKTWWKFAASFHSFSTNSITWADEISSTAWQWMAFVTKSKLEHILMWFSTNVYMSHYSEWHTVVILEI